MNTQFPSTFARPKAKKDALLRPGTETRNQWIRRIPPTFGAIAEAHGGVPDAVIPSGYRFDDRDAFTAVSRLIAEAVAA